ncbi:MAG: superoxide dismutase [Lentisphaerae bacterium GWF2_50_93]|nr:MAG: superoxide dismutase [Lentisphaerae bacterium GWF2_50_93]
MSFSGFSDAPAVGAIELPKLPYGENALEPVISAKTMGFHYGKHHKAYVDKLNSLLKDSPLKGKSLEGIIVASAGKEDMAGIFNNAAQAWNHSFFWKSMKPAGGGEPRGKLLELINKSFGSYAEFKKQFADAGAAQFGSGWGWLVQDGDKLKIMKTSNADTPIAHNLNPLITCDVWEHAYYLDYQNRRGDFINAFLDKLVNWDFAEANLK